MPLVVAALALACLIAPSEVPEVRLEWMNRGISLIPAWTKDPVPGLGGIDDSLKPEDFKQLETLGFRHVRVNLGNPEGKRPPKKLREILDADLAAVLSVDPSDAVSWPTVASLLSNFDENKVFIEVSPEMVTAARHALPGVTLIANLQGPLSDAKPLADGNVVYRSTFLEPVTFTKQKPRLNLPYPSSPLLLAELLPDLEDADKPAAKAYGDARWDKQKLNRLARKCSEWGVKYRVPVMCEFGCSISAPSDSRAQWLTDARSVLESNDVSWEVEDYDGPAKLFRGSPRNRTPDSSLLKALGLSQ